MEKFSIKKRIQSFGYTWKGIWSFVSKEHNAWIHCAAIITVATAGFYFGITRNEWITIILYFGMVPATEGFNTAIGRLANLVSPEHNPIAGDVKDIAVGVVPIHVIVAVIIGVIIFMPYMLTVLLRSVGQTIKTNSAALRQFIAKLRSPFFRYTYTVYLTLFLLK